MTLPFIAGSDVSYAHPDGSLLFEKLNFSLQSRTCGLIGQNGSGKTTLLKLISGERSPASGAIHREGSITMLAQRLMPGAAETVAQALGAAAVIDAFERVERGETEGPLLELVAENWDIHERLNQALQKTGLARVSLDRLVESLSGGERIRLSLARVLLDRADLILLDEPTNHLDRDSRRALFRFIAESRARFLIVSHDRELLEQVDEIWELSALGLKTYGGNHSFYREQRAIEDQAAERAVQSAEQGLDAQRKKLAQSIARQQKRSARASRDSESLGLPKIVRGNLKRQAQNTAARLKGTHEGRVARSREQLDSARAQLRLQSEILVDLPETSLPPGKLVLKMESLNFRYPGCETWVFREDVSLALQGPERVAIEGANGSGKSTLLRLLRGDLREGMLEGELRGEVRLTGVECAYLDQRVALLDDELSVLENLRLHAPGVPEHELRIRLGRFLFAQELMLKKARALSGGERIRAGLACVLGAVPAPKLLILDEPTNDLDLESLHALESALSRFEGAMLIVSHDESFLEAIGVDRRYRL